MYILSPIRKWWSSILYVTSTVDYKCMYALVMYFNIDHLFLFLPLISILLYIYIYIFFLIHIDHCLK